MPIYEYRCINCGKTIEVVQKISDIPFTECENCSGKLKKLISKSSFSLKGSGWYVTDYAKKTGGGNTSEKTKTDSPPDSGEPKGEPKKDNNKKSEES